MRRRLQSLLMPSSRGGGSSAAGGGATSSRRTLLLIALGSLVMMAVLSMATLSTSPTLRSLTLRSSSSSSPFSGTSPPDLKRRARVAAVAESLTQVALQTTAPRGLVLPLFNGIAFLGISLVMELRAMGVDLPIEIPHCGDLDEKLRSRLQTLDDGVRVYDVCLAASAPTFTVGGEKKKLFCKNVGECHKRFRNFDVKIISLLLSRFEEVMMLDADTLFFQSPMKIWSSPKFLETGTLFFHDRISCDHEFLATRRKNRNNITHLEEYLSGFDVEPFKPLGHVPRPRAVATAAHKPSTVNLPFAPSEFLLTSHTWNRRAGHQADSSLMLWNKKKQPRATAILGSFIAHGGTGRPPSYGDKEFYFIACELAETAYAFSDFGTGAIGLDARQVDTPGRSVLCGDALHYVPDALGMNGDPPTLYINSDHITSWKPTDKLYRTKARPASFFPGKIEDRGLAQECPFDVTLDRISEDELALLARRQKFVAVAKSWNATKS